MDEGGTPKRRLSGMGSALLGAGLLYFYLTFARTKGLLFVFAALFGGVLLARGIATILNLRRPG